MIKYKGEKDRVLEIYDEIWEDASSINCKYPTIISIENRLLMSISRKIYKLEETNKKLEEKINKRRKL